MTTSPTPSGHKHGYARVSTQDQNLDLQVQALERAGCARIWQEHASGALRERPQLDQMLESILPGDTVVVWRLDRLGRSMAHLVTTIDNLAARGVGFISLTEGVDTTSASGRLVLGVFAALSEFERELVRERTNAGLAAARERGVTLGRPSVVTPQKLAAARVLIDQGSTVADAAKAVGLSRPTLYRHMKAVALPQR